MELLRVTLLMSAVVIAVGCRPERMLSSAGNPRSVSFTQAGVSLVLGKEWQPQGGVPDQGLYPKTLVSHEGSIRVVLLPPDRSDPEVVADWLRAAFELNPRSAKHSFRKKQFANQQGIHGLCITYLLQTGTIGSGLALENSHYLLMSRAGRCVAVKYVGAQEVDDSSEVHRMLLAGLSLQ
jgi:hypothetical protein